MDKSNYASVHMYKNRKKVQEKYVRNIHEKVVLSFVYKEFK